MILKLIAGLVVGGAFGFFLGSQLSQAGGSCPLTCNPHIGAFYWGAIGVLVASLI